MTLGDPAFAHLPEAIEAGLVDEEVLDASVRRVLTAKVRMGLLDQPYVDEERSPDGAQRPGPSRGGPHGCAAVGGPASQRG